MLQITGLLFWLIIIPFCIGLIPAGFIPENKRSLGFTFLAGYFTMWALYAAVTIPVVLFVKYDNFILASNCFMILSILGAVAGTVFAYRGRKAALHGSGCLDKNFGESGYVCGGKRLADRIRKMSWAERIEWLLFFCLLGFQLYKAVACASFDGDDAYYVVESLIAQQAGTMYSILPYTGRHTGLDIRHAMAVFPMWIAFVATKSHIHATILSHTIMPVVLIPLTYLVYFEIGRALFRKTGSKHETFCSENLPVFMILMGIFQIFGNASIYTNETFFLTRTWQGKSVAGSLVIPAFLWLFLLIYDGTGGRGRRAGGNIAGFWFLLVCVNMTAGICSSIVVFLVSILMAVTALCLAFAERDFKVVLRMGAACIPNAVYMLTYLVMGYGYLLQQIL